MSASLGGLIKDYRVQKNLSQLEIAFALGWKEPSRLSRIEQGRVSNPPRELIDRIIEVMDLKEEEKNHLLLIGNYLPTQEEIEKIRKEVGPIINNWPYPAAIYDFSWRFLSWNTPTDNVYGIDKKSKMYFTSNIPRNLNFVFDPNFMQNKYLKGKEVEMWHEFLLNKLILFKYAQKTRSKDTWYIDFIKSMMENDLFRSLWPMAKLAEGTKNLSEYERKTIIDLQNMRKRLEFHLFKTTILQNPRFGVEYHIPANVDTFQHFNHPISEVTD